jgi:phage tail tape-measure protein
MSKKLIAFMLVTSLISSSCSSTRKSIALGIGTGAVVGAASGTALGNIYGKQGQGAITGGVIGALVGGIASYFIDGGLKKRDEETRKETLFNLEKHGVFGPELTTPEQKEKERYWKDQESRWFREFPERGMR